ncbi:MAG: hypothetical protein VCF24_01225 [Candidatus Latescibacterota bacterium]
MNYQRTTPLTAAVAGILMSYMLADDAAARPHRPGQIPSGLVNNCLNCHVSPGAGDLRNPFGLTVEGDFLTAINLSGNVIWGPELAAIDSDGDGFTNGEELGDPEGTWQPGDPAPINAADVTLPGDPDSHPPEGIITAVWEHPLPDSVLSGALLAMEATVHLIRFAAEGETPRLTADLSAFGGPIALPLVAVGDGTYRLEFTLSVDVPNGLKPVLIRIEQGTHSTKLVKNLVVLPIQDHVIFGDALSGNWQVESSTGGAEAPSFTAAGPVYAGEVASAIQVDPGSFVGWSVKFQAATPVNPFGHELLRFAFHPGDATGRAISIRVGDQAFALMGRRAREGIGVDLEVADWQVVEIPLDESGITEPIKCGLYRGSGGHVLH